MKISSFIPYPSGRMFHRTIIVFLIDRDWDAAEAALIEHSLRAHQKLHDSDIRSIVGKSS